MNKQFEFTSYFPHSPFFYIIDLQWLSRVVHSFSTSIHSHSTPFLWLFAAHSPKPATGKPSMIFSPVEKIKT